MKNIVYFCPKSNVPTGGIKVIHRHSERIRQLGRNSEVFYFDNPESQDIDWFTHKTKIRTNSQFSSQDDYIILPECHAYRFWMQLKSHNIKYAIFVQNGYYIAAGFVKDSLTECYKNADLIICISNDVLNGFLNLFPQFSNKCIRVTYSIDGEQFKKAESKRNVVTYMPRKLPQHSNFLIKLLETRLPPNWSVDKIDGLNESGVAEKLSKSRVFLAFSDREGLPVPPVEAAFCENFVIGYHGQGGAEYWLDPVFTNIQIGDIYGFFSKVIERIQLIDAYQVSPDTSIITHIRSIFSNESELKKLKFMLDRIV